MNGPSLSSNNRFSAPNSSNSLQAAQLKFAGAKSTYDEVGTKVSGGRMMSRVEFYGGDKRTFDLLRF